MFRIARLLTALLAFTLLAANGASAITASLTEKPASGLFGVFEHRVGVDALASTDRVDEKLSLLYDFASDFPVAARGATRTGAVVANERNLFGRLSWNNPRRSDQANDPYRGAHPQRRGYAHNSPRRRRVRRPG